MPTLPNNLTGIDPVSDWNDLSAWLGELDKSARKSVAIRRKVAPTPPVLPPRSDEERRSYLAISQYLMDLESTGLAEQVLAGALLDKIHDKAEFDLEWLATEVANFTEVGMGLARALASATLSYLAGLKLVEVGAGGRFKTVVDAVSTLVKRATGEWLKDKTNFYNSIAKRLGVAADLNLDKFNEQLDDILQILCVNFGQGMAEWVHRGIGRELGWKRAQEVVDTQIKDKEEARKAKTVLELMFARPYDDEIPYLYRLLGAAFLSNSVRLDPFASRVVKTTLSSYELCLDSNVLLPLVIKEHDDHSMMKEIIKESQDAGVRLFVLQSFYEEICGHLDVAKRTVEECGGDLRALSEIVTIWGKHANCFIQGYLNTLEPSEIDTGGKTGNASVKWEDYWHKYAPGQLSREIDELGIALVPAFPTGQFSSTREYQEVLSSIIQEWDRRKRSLYPRAPVLNQNEALQFCYVYHRRQERKASGLSSEVWFLSFETLLAAVFAHNASKWRLPPTFPFSAWVAFLDSRLPHAPKNPTAIVNAILKGNPETFDLPDPVALVRNKAFGDRVPTKVEEEALQLELSSFALIQRVEKARSAILSRGHKKGKTEESREAIKTAVGEIAREMGETIHRLQEELAKQKELAKGQVEPVEQMTGEKPQKPRLRPITKPKTEKASYRKKRRH